MHGFADSQVQRANYARVFVLGTLQDDSMDTGWFKARLEEVHKTRSDVGAAISRDRTVASKILSGKQSMRVDEVVPIAGVLDVPPLEVIKRVGIPIDQYAALGMPESEAILEVDVTAAAGGGLEVAEEPELGSWVFPAQWLRHELHAGSSDLRIITIVGDSMEGVLEPGDKVLVNTTKAGPSPPGCGPSRSASSTRHYR